MSLKCRALVYVFTAFIVAGTIIPRMTFAQAGDLPPLDVPEMGDEPAPPSPPDRPMMRAMRPGMQDQPGMEMGAMRERRQRMSLERIKSEDPERYKRLTRIDELCQEYKSSADDKRKKEIEKELRPLIDQELRLQQEAAKKKLEEMEKKLDEWKKKLEERDDNWDQVVDHQLKKKTGQIDYMEFPGSPLR